MRDALWFLSGYWLRPERQRQGIGAPLLRRVWAEGQKAGATTFFTWSSIDLTAMAMYLKLGMLPGYQIFSFTGELTAPPEPPRGYDARSLALNTAAAIDRELLSAPRELDHRFWHAQPGRTAREVVRGRRVVGYYSVEAGTVGPAAWRDADDAGAVLSLALREAAAQSTTVRLRALGVNHDAIREALGAGLRLTGCSHLLVSAPFGALDRYVPSGQTLF